MNDTEDAKANARKVAFAARKLAHKEAVTKTPKATKRLLQAIGPANGQIIAGYLPIRTEIDPRPAMQDLYAQGARLCVPVIKGAGHPLDFREWRPDVDLVEGPFGAAVPASGEFLTPVTLIVPLVAFDRDLNRLGYGGGFYDRTLERLRKAQPTRAIGFAYSAQECTELPQEPTDQKLDVLVNEAVTLAAPINEA